MIKISKSKGSRSIWLLMGMLLTANICLAQADTFKKQRANLALYNIGFNGLIGGVVVP